MRHFSVAAAMTVKGRQFKGLRGFARSVCGRCVALGKDHFSEE